MNWYKQIRAARDWSVIPEKLRYWGLDPNEWSGQWRDYTLLADSPDLMNIPFERVSAAASYLAQEHFPNLIEGLREVSEFCRANFYIPSREEEPEYEEFVNVMRDQSYRAAAGVAERSELREQRVIEELSRLIYEMAEIQIGKLLNEEVKNETFFVRVYGSSQAYGGAEEGGWWYNDNQQVHAEQVQGLQNACHRKSQLEQEYKNMGKDSFYEDLENFHGGVRDLYDETSSSATGMGDLDYGEQDSEGMHYPQGWKPSAYEEYFVQVELAEKPIKETTEIPHYE